MDTLSDEELRVILGVGADADPKALRAAYLGKIREHPPERDPEMFERVRDAYQILTDPRRKMRRWFDPDELRRPMHELAPETGDREGRVFLGIEAWVSLLGHAERVFRKSRGERP